METERLILDSIRESDKEDYFINISHDKKVLETFICRYAETLEEFDFSSYPGRQDVFAIMPRMCEGIAAALQDGKTAFIDHVITSFRIWPGLVQCGFRISDENGSGPLRCRDAASAGGRTG